MKDADFENKLRERLGEDTTPLDLDLEWADFERRRGKKDRKPFFWFWCGAAFVLLGVVGWGIAVFAEAKEIDVTLLSADTSEKKISEYDQSAQAVKKLEDEIVNNVGLQNDSDLNNEVENEKEKLNNNINTIEKVAQETTITKVQKSDKNKVGTSVKSEKEKVISENKIPSDQEDIKADLAQSITESMDKSRAMVAAEFDDAKTPENSSVLVDVNVLHNLKKLFLPTITIKTSFEPATDLSVLATSSAVFPLKKHSKWKIGIQGTFGQSYRTLKATDPERAPYVQQRNDSEKALEVWSTSINLTRKITKHWFTELSLGYSRTTDRFTNVSETETQELLDDQVAGIINKADGEREFIYGQLLATNTTTTTGTYFQTDQQGFIQLSAGRYLPLNNQFGLVLSSGLSYGFYVRKDGPVFNSQNPMLFNDLKDSGFKKKGLWTALAQVNVYYQLSSVWECSIGLRGATSLNNAYMPNSDISEKRKSIVGIVGVSRWF